MVQKNNIFDNPDNVREWLCSTGYLFPSNELELARFNKLFVVPESRPSTVSIERILNNEARSFPDSDLFRKDNEQDIIDQFKMVARKGFEGIPDHIIKKMKGNQDKDEGSSEKED